MTTLLRSCAVLLVLTFATAGKGDSIYLRVDLTLSSSQYLYSRGYVEYAASNGFVDQTKLVDIYHAIIGTSASWTGVRTTPYSTPMLSGGMATPPNCYVARITGTSVENSNVWNTTNSGEQICLQGPEPCDTCPRDPCEVDPASCNNSPLVLSLDGGLYRLTGISDPVLFDIDADGAADVTGWTGRGSEVGLLARDRNGNSLIDDGSELFGEATPNVAASGYRNGFDALAAEDTNGDGVIGPGDRHWAELLLWFDRDHDGVSASSELSSVASLGIGWLGYRYGVLARRDPHGNIFRLMGRFELDGQERMYFDVYFVEGR